MPLELRQYSDLSRHIKEPLNGIYCLNFFKKIKDKIWKLTLCFTPEVTYCLTCWRIVSFFFAPRCIFHCVRTWGVVWERRGLSDIATVTKGGGSLWRLDIFNLTRCLKNTALMKELLQKMQDVSATVIQVLYLVHKYYKWYIEVSKVYTLAVVGSNWLHVIWVT